MMEDEVDTENNILHNFIEITLKKINTYQNPNNQWTAACHVGLDNDGGVAAEWLGGWVKIAQWQSGIKWHSGKWKSGYIESDGVSGLSGWVAKGWRVNGWLDGNWLSG